MDERSHLKRNTGECYQINNKIKVECLKAQEEWLNNESKLFYSTLKDKSRKDNSIKSSCIRDKDGNILMNTDDIIKQWVENVGDLYPDPSRGIVKSMSR